jgi:adenine phosphoribosyltransferase
MGPAAALDLKTYVRDIPDFPKKGIVFKDITPMLADPKAYATAINMIADHYKDMGIDRVAGIEARGFLFASAVAARLGAGLIPVRKKGKLPHDTHAAEYDLEYGTDTVEIHQDAAGAGHKVLVLDDVIATGGTAAATVKLIEQTGAQVSGVCFFIELDFLKGREKLAGHDIYSVLHY